MFFLLILDFSSYLTSNSSFANLVISTIINIQSLNFSGLLLWVVAVLLRYWDFYKFNNKDIGFFRGIKATIRGLSYSYIIPSFISLIIITFAMFINPLTRFMTLSGFDTSADYLARGGSFIGLFFDSSYNSEDFPFHTSFATGIRKLTNDSNNKEGYLDLSDAYLGAITYSKDDIVKNVEILDRERRFNYDFTERNFFIKAKQLLELAKDEKSHKYIERLAVINILDKNYSLAEKSILKLIEIDNKPSNKLFLASLYVFLNKNDKALEIYKAESLKNPNISSLYYQLRSSLYENNKDYKKSLLEYVEAYRLNKNIHLP
ncbi:MAG: tetratricopeptide repeat protein, partial [Candidatus Sericytochromatia bacterium]